MSELASESLAQCDSAKELAPSEPVRESLAPSGARVAINVDGDTIAVEVNAEPAGGLRGIHVTGRAYAVAEPGAGQDGGAP